jgi:hypothetical protein
MQKLKWITTGLLILAGTSLGLGTATAQDSFSSINVELAAPTDTAPVLMSATDMRELRTLSEAQLTAFVGVLATLPEIAADALPRKGMAGTFYSLQHPEWPPLPGNMHGSPVWQMKDFYLLDDLDCDYTPKTKSTSLGMQAMSVPSPGDGGGTNVYTPNGLGYTLPDYGTNLWIAQVALTNGYLTGIASNTLADVRYETMVNADLTQTNWSSTGQFIFGSTTTNWTPLEAVPVSLTNNLFIRLRSWADGGSGLPLWWQWQYFGTNNVDPYGNPAGDGWSNLQKFQNGWDPNQFYTPAAPQGVTASLHQVSSTATVNWLPAAGNVTGYTVEKTDPYADPIIVEDFTVNAGTTSYQDDISGSIPDPWNGNAYDVSYQVKANYSGGNSSAWTPAILLQQPTVSASITPGANGTAYLAVSGVPANAVTVRLVFMQENALDNLGPSFAYAEDIALSAFTNGMYQLPAAWQPPVIAYTGFSAFVQSVDSNGNASAGTFVYNQNWGQSFYDGRVQLKQNLIFKLRAASENQPFQFTQLYTVNNDTYYTLISEPTNYAYAGFYSFNTYYDGYYGKTVYEPYADTFLPFKDNYLYRNFVFDLSGVNQYGLLTSFDNDFNAWRDGPLALNESPAYQFQPPANNEDTIAPLLGADQTRWLLSFLLYGYNYYDQIGIINLGGSTNQMATGAHNTFGLPFLSTEIARGNTGPQTETLYPGDISTTDGVFYTETAQPQFSTVEYDFFQPNWVWNSASQTWTLPELPGIPYFSPTNQSQQFFIGVGNSIQIAGYAKMAVTNGYSGVYGFLGQYFDQAYQTDTNGIATATPTGVLSPYGNFFATEPGQAALVTMRDIDTDERGTGIVHCVSLNVDKNHDGVMDLSFSGADATSQGSPFVFWANNNYDRWTLDKDDGTNYDDDVLNTSQAATCPFTPQTPTPDCNYKDQYGNRMIPCARDLQDFFRLWVCGIDSNLVSKLPAGSTITLNWGDEGSPNSANPTIDLFHAVEPDGGIGYLTNATIAAQQANPFYAGYVGRVGPGQSLQLYPPLPYGGNYWQGSHYLMCGVSNGTGGLNLTIKDGNGNVLAQSTSYLQIVDIKQMYERWTVGDQPSRAPLTNALPATEDLPMGASAFRYTQPPDTNTPYILYVHGWNMSRYDKDRFAETAFKRLYWQGYKGRFGVFRWPTDYDFNATLMDALFQPHNYDGSENNSWQSAVGLLNKLNDLNAQYPGQVYVLAHSMGNVITGEALRLAAQQGLGQLVNTYVASQGAIPAHVYDATVTSPYLINYAHLNPSVPLSAPGHPKTPNIYGNRLTNNVTAAGRRINFYNVNDYALSPDAWCTDQEMKPDTFPSGIYLYTGGTNDTAPWNNFRYEYFVGTYRQLDIVNNLNNRYEALAYAANPYSTALGATPIGTFTRGVDLSQIWPSDTVHPAHPFDEHFYHSAEFRGDYWQMQGYWRELLSSDAFNLK